MKDEGFDKENVGSRNRNNFEEKCTIFYLNHNFYLLGT